MKDARSSILYIGKAINLRSRVRSYFGKSNDGRPFIRLLMKRIDDLDCILTETEEEALILENNLIKKHRPLYNVRLKDDKTYVSIKVTLSEEWPRVMITRRYRQGKDLYFGPYGSSTAVREMLRVIKTVFPLRTCTNGFFRNRTRACMEYEIGRCTAPCVDLISKEDYMEDVAEVVLLLKRPRGGAPAAVAAPVATNTPAAAAAPQKAAGRGGRGGRRSKADLDRLYRES